MIDEELAAVLDANRTALIDSVARLTDAQSRSRLVPSLTTPIALVKHCAAAERVWFQRTVAGLAEAECDGYATGDDRSWLVDPDQTLADVIAEFAAVAERSRRIAQGPDPTDRFVHYRRGEVTFRWIGLHMIEELARHAGHADILVEQILADPSASRTSL
ncbi:DinB family protein [Williamsia sp. 1135]|uniref:DinB family protein n=1 Tax=Williamsia sp. 1135 TaxID=1889262 RepID=UPI000A104FDA|nr:DinB family protein [Williamsia sp. 1135]ORM26812.1 mini-circle protein [Williamsia sp. 1135]